MKKIRRELKKCSA